MEEGVGGGGYVEEWDGVEEGDVKGVGWRRVWGGGG